RYDRSGRANNANLIDSGFSTILTYWPSEFSQIRGQYRFAHYAEGRDGNELRFQLQFSLGAHGAHPF
ncbi:MAG: TonB-dependent receptor, partial [Terriglobia bacterium]